ncbi:hypothetical protein [Reichenbachiella sp.]|uniref:hypothetical protein n=1 Tax=Reichenbachiella sp. TaxID=2184521 RepID=UPI003B5C4390
MNYKFTSEDKKIRWCIIIVMMVVFQTKLIAQFDMSEIERSILPPSPTAGQLGRYGEIPVSLSSGLPSVSVPLTDFEVGDINVPITLSYYSGGLKVDQSPSWVGMGWSLLAGGVITRTIVDRPDEIGALPYPENMDTEDLEAINYIENAMDDGDIHFDSELDIYSYNFQGKAGKFVIDRNGKAVIYPRQNFDLIRRVDPSGAEKMQIILIDSRGFKYYFGGNEGTEFSKSQWSGLNCGKNFDTFAATAFHLIKIESPKGNAVHFEYNLYHHSYPAGVNETAKYFINRINRCAAEQPVESYQSTDCINTIEVKEKRLARIYGVGFGEMTFHTDNTYFLKDITDNSGVQGTRRKFDFEYEITQNQRTFLKSIVERGATLNQQRDYKFDYHDKDEFPEILSKSRDHWGYYNGVNNSTLLDGSGLSSQFSSYNADRKPNLEATRKGVLNRITYPTGGSTLFDYELNLIRESELEKPPVTEIKKSLDGGENASDVTREEFYQLGTFQYDQNIKYYAKSSIWEGKLPQLASTKFSISDKTDNKIVLNKNLNNDESDNANNTFPVKAGHHYELKLEANGQMSIDFGFEYYSIEPEMKPVTKKLGGLRIKRLVNSDLTGKNNIKTYHYGPKTNLDVTSGKSRNQPTYYREVLQTQQCEDGSSGSGISGLYETLVYGQLQSSSIQNLYLTNGSHVTYEYVNVSYGENFEGGGEQHKFKVSQDSNGKLIFGDNDHHRQNLNNSGYENGQELEVETYRFENGFPKVVTRTINEYTLDQGKQYTANSIVIDKKMQSLYSNSVEVVCDSDTENDVVRIHHCAATESHIHEYRYVEEEKRLKCFAEGNDNVNTERRLLCYGITPGETVSFTSNLHQGGIDIMEYYFKNFWSYLSKSTHFLFDETEQNWIKTVTEYIYDNPDHLQLSQTVTKRELEKELISKFKYAQDYSYEVHSVLDKMIDRNMTGVPIEKIQKVGEAVVSAQAVKYEHLISEDMIAPKTYYVFDSNSPSVIFAGSVNGESFPEYRITGNVLERDERGNILSLKKENDLIVSYIWGYQKSKLVAKVINASFTEVAGYVTAIQSASNADNDHCLLGESCNEALLLSALQSLRNAPELSNALITTYTHDPSIGLTSETGPDGKISYFEYDDLGRVNLIKDQDGHVLKAYKYQYADLSTQ